MIDALNDNLDAQELDDVSDYIEFNVESEELEEVSEESEGDVDLSHTSQNMKGNCTMAGTFNMGNRMGVLRHDDEKEKILLQDLNLAFRVNGK